MKAAVVCANEDVQYLDYEEPKSRAGNREGESESFWNLRI